MESFKNTHSIYKKATSNLHSPGRKQIIHESVQSDSYIKLMYYYRKTVKTPENIRVYPAKRSTQAWLKTIRFSMTNQVMNNIIRLQPAFSSGSQINLDLHFFELYLYQVSKCVIAILLAKIITLLCICQQLITYRFRSFSQ